MEPFSAFEEDQTLMLLCGDFGLAPQTLISQLGFRRITQIPRKCQNAQMYDDFMKGQRWITSKALREGIIEPDFVLGCQTRRPLHNPDHPNQTLTNQT